MFKIEIIHPEGKLLECKFQPTDYPLINLFFKNNELKTKVYYWKGEPHNSDKLQNNKYLIDITVSESSFHKILGDISVQPATDFFSGYYLKPFSLPIRVIIADILMYSCHLKFKRLYLHTKISELFIQLLSATAIEEPGVQWTEKEQQTFQQLKELISGDLKNNYSIADLAQIAGMNRTKMQAGFKDFYGKTIYAYALDLKMAEAKTMLVKAPKGSLKEIAAHLGYKHTSHFSAAFKKKFSFSPSFFKQGANLISTLFLAFAW